MSLAAMAMKPSSVWKRRIVFLAIVVAIASNVRLVPFLPSTGVMVSPSSSPSSTTTTTTTTTTTLTRIFDNNIGTNNTNPDPIQTVATRLKTSTISGSTAATQQLQQPLFLQPQQQSISQQSALITTQLPITQCSPYPSKWIPRITTHNNFPYYNNLSNFLHQAPLNVLEHKNKKMMVTETSSSSKEEQENYRHFLICEMDETIPHASTHFAHAMQQLYGCWSLWESQGYHPNANGTLNKDNYINSTTTTTKQRPQQQVPILLLSPKLQRQWKQQAFLSGFLECLIQSYRVQIMSKQEFIDTYTKSWPTNKQSNKNKNRMRKSKTNSNLKANTNQQQTSLVRFSIYKLSISGGYTLQHAGQLGEMVVSHHTTTKEKTRSSATLVSTMQTSTTNSSNEDNDTATTTTTTLWIPQIGILNRRKSVGRSLLNAIQLESKLKELQNNWTTTSNPTTTTTTTNQTMAQDATAATLVLPSKEIVLKPNVTIMYFEGASFWEQVQFFRSVDILISPHGAQWTGVPFLMAPPPPPTTTTTTTTTNGGQNSMPNDTKNRHTTRACKFALELFPHKYLLPTFFGSLVHASGIHYSYMYLSEEDASNSSSSSSSNTLTLAQRIQARATNLCPPLDSLVHAIQEMVHEWKICIQQQQQQDNED